jgi:hypothetical protein
MCEPGARRDQEAGEPMVSDIRADADQRYLRIEEAARCTE